MRCRLSIAIYLTAPYFVCAISAAGRLTVRTCRLYTPHLRLLLLLERRGFGKNNILVAFSADYEKVPFSRLCSVAGFHQFHSHVDSLPILVASRGLTVSESGFMIGTQTFADAALRPRVAVLKSKEAAGLIHRRLFDCRIEAGAILIVASSTSWRNLTQLMSAARFMFSPADFHQAVDKSGACRLRP